MTHLSSSRNVSEVVPVTGSVHQVVFIKTNQKKNPKHFRREKTNKAEGRPHETNRRVALLFFSKVTRSISETHPHKKNCPKPSFI